MPNPPPNQVDGPGDAIANAFRQLCDPEIMEMRDYRSLGRILDRALDLVKEVKAELDTLRPQQRFGKFSTRHRS
jgi:hypothetical protein